MTFSKLRVGIIGCGMVANVGHLPIYQKSPLTEVIAVADPLESHLKNVQDKYNIPKIYKNPYDLIDDGDIDAISICSPHWAHAKQTIKAAKNGKHILCEKPIGINLEEVDGMIKAVEKNDVIFQTATQKRFDSGFQFIKNNVNNGEIGNIFQASVFWYHSMPDLGPIPNKDLIQEAGLWRLTDKRINGGDLLDHGPHYFDLFRWWFGDVKSVSAQIRRIRSNRVNEDHSNVILSFKNSDIVALFERSEAIFGGLFGEEMGRIHGTEGTYYFNVPSEYKKKPMKLVKYYKKNLTSKPSKVKVPFSKDPLKQPYAREVLTFINQCLDRSNEDIGFPMEWIPTIYDGRAALEIVLASYESQRRNKRIKLPLKEFNPLQWNNEFLSC